jgi:hypothetical protein
MFETLAEGEEASRMKNELNYAQFMSQDEIVKNDSSLNRFRHKDHIANRDI